jgi:hypothetical protein
MTVEQLVRDQLDRATQHVPAGPDLEAVVSTGRRRRRNRRVGLASAAVAAAVVVPLAVVSFVPADQAPEPVNSRAADQPPPPVARVLSTDYVPGTDVDETMIAVVAGHLNLPDAADVYPSDSVHAGPMTDADFARATDWIATYDLSDQQIDIAMGYADPANLSCAGAGCTATPVAGGELQLRESRGWHKPDHAHTGQWVFITQFVRGASYVSVREVIVASSLEEARSHRTLDHNAVVDLVSDPRLTFARP